MAKRYVPVGNHILNDTRLYPSTLRVLVAMHALKGRKNYLCATQEKLAQVSHCCLKTVRQALEQLRELGYLQTLRRLRYSAAIGRKVYAANGYVLRGISLEDGYTLVPCALLNADITHCAFSVLCHGYKYSGRSGRFYASLRHMANICVLSKATVVRALTQLRKLQLVVRLYCKKMNCSLSCNSYYPTALVQSLKDGEKDFYGKGGLIFTQHLFNKKITGDSIRREEIYGVVQFGKKHKKTESLSSGKPVALKGIAVSVSANEEQLLTS